MRKYSSCMRWKSILYASFFLLLILSITTTGVSAQPDIYVDPPLATISAIGATETIEINVTGVTNLFGYDIAVSYDTTLLEVTDVTVTGTGQVVPANPAQYDLTDLSNATHVIISLAFLEGMGATPFSGSGTLLWITFNGTAEGTSPVDLITSDTLLYNQLAIPIPIGNIYDGEIVVVPEFPAAIATSLLLIATLAAALLGKVVWSRKRRGSPT